ncbi:hypothetical protein [Microtetraspora sp. NBRC 16547]|uniref:hypothetical protein n=1 Tax=Microtetraspora sp. NBRC 16547 TaxID=3030993 RepID=UPI002555431A|nr:hypothetical protein [Microtetraspora sp. NBRC 16547]
MDSARREREPGTPPRSLVALAATALIAATGYALCLLPAQVRPDWSATTSAPSPEPSATSPRPGVIAGSPVALRTPEPSGPVPVAVRSGSPSGYVVFVDAVRDPEFDLAGTARRTGAGWYTIGHLAAGPDGCTPRWGGITEQGRNPIANRIGSLRARGGDAGLAFGGPSARELAATCPDLDRLLAAYRRVIGSFAPAVIDFEIRDSTDPAATGRRAAALSVLQREAAASGRALTVTFTLPASESGLSASDSAMLRTVRAAGVDIRAVNLLVPFQPGVPGNLHRLATAARAAHAQFPYALGVADGPAWQRMGLTPVLAAPQDLGPGQARRLAAFRMRNGLAWVSVRGAPPSDEVSRILGATRP